jgi:hypothetical protein
MSQSTDQRHYRYSFKRHIDIHDVQDTLTLAIIGAENLHGRARLRLDGWWRLDRQRRQCIIDASTQVGRDIARLFTGYLSREFGEAAFSVTRVPGRPGRQRSKRQTPSPWRQHRT